MSPPTLGNLAPSRRSRCGRVSIGDDVCALVCYPRKEGERAERGRKVPRRRSKDPPQVFMETPAELLSLFFCWLFSALRTTTSPPPSKSITAQLTGMWKSLGKPCL